MTPRLYQHTRWGLFSVWLYLSGKKREERERKVGELIHTEKGGETNKWLSRLTLSIHEWNVDVGHGVKCIHHEPESKKKRKKRADLSDTNTNNRDKSFWIFDAPAVRNRKYFQRIIPEQKKCKHNNNKQRLCAAPLIKANSSNYIQVNRTASRQNKR